MEVIPNISKIWLEEHPDIEVKSDGTQSVTQGVTQDVTQEKDLNQWIEYQVATNPKIVKL